LFIVLYGAPGIPDSTEITSITISKKLDALFCAEVDFIEKTAGSNNNDYKIGIGFWRYSTSAESIIFTGSTENNNISLFTGFRYARSTV
jgi:hypothetical protein